MELIYDIGNCKIAQIGSLHRIILPILLILHLQLDNVGPHDSLNAILKSKSKSHILSRMNENGRMILRVFRIGLTDTKKLKINMEFLIKTHGILMKQDFGLVWEESN